MKEIPLTQGKVALVDDKDWEWARHYRWFAVKKKIRNGFNWYARRNTFGRKGKRIYLHREIAQRAGLPFSRYYDHADRNSLNNQRYNIRPCNQSQNIANSRRRHKKDSHFKGVYWHDRLQKWYAKIMVNYQSRHLGVFESEEEAALAYAVAARKAWGEFANPC